MKPRRADREGQFRTAFEKNRKKIMISQTVCGICGRPVDKSLKMPDPMAPTVDHIVPIAKGGHPSDIDNLQLAHFICNRLKSDKLQREIRIGNATVTTDVISNRDLPLSMDWTAFRPGKA